MTVNTDFAETEVDDRVVQLTRFPIFFPEKRDFFLEDVGIFSFGGLRRQNIPFFSRRIGISSTREPVPILGGLKLTGRIDDLNLGVLGVMQDARDDVDAKALGVLRAALNVGAEAQVGAIVTYGDAETNGDNGVVGVDFGYRTTNLWGDRVFRFDAYAMTSLDDPAGDDGSRQGYAYGIKFDYPNDIIVAEIGYRETSDDFFADLGFVPRRGVRRLFGEFFWRPRPKSDLVRRLTFGVDSQIFWNIADGQPESADARFIPFEVLFHSGDEIGLWVEPQHERLLDPFEIFPGVTLPQEKYDFVEGGIDLVFSDRRILSGSIGASYGSFFGGTRFVAQADATWRPAPGFTLQGSWEHNTVHLDEGDFATNLATLQLVWDFTPDLTWKTFIQYDDVSDSVGINSRLRWILEPGRNLFFVVNAGATTQDEDGRFRF